MLLLVVDVMDINYSTIWRLFSFLFSPPFTLFSQPLAMDTLPCLYDLKQPTRRFLSAESIWGKEWCYSYVGRFLFSIYVYIYVYHARGSERKQTEERVEQA